MTVSHREPHHATQMAAPGPEDATAESRKRAHASESKPNAASKRPASREHQCGFFLAHKQRMCPMQRKKGHLYCSEHMVQEKTTNGRVPCPLDPKHSVWEKDLASHVKKCNAKPREHEAPWYKKNANTFLRGSDEGMRIGKGLGRGETELVRDPLPRTSSETSGAETSGAETSGAETSGAKTGEAKTGEAETSGAKTGEAETNLSYSSLFAILEELDAATQAPPKQRLSHRGLDGWLEAKANQKHILQQSSLIGNLRQAGLLSSDNYYVEFGCGKAELSRAINLCIAHDSGAVNGDAASDSGHGTEGTPGYGFGLIDRGVNRMKTDSKLRTETGLRPHVKRSRIDIEHLDLDGFLDSEPHGSWVGVSKHLCGVATDLTLKSILNSCSAKAKLRGLVVAMCCRHVCHYMQLLPASRDYLSRHGVCDEASFALLKRVVSWAVCGRRDETKVDLEASHDTGLTYEARERYGFLARRLIDLSRVHAVECLMPEYSAQLVLYADTETTLENHCLIIRRS